MDDPAGVKRPWRACRVTAADIPLLTVNVIWPGRGADLIGY